MEIQPQRLLRAAPPPLTLPPPQPVPPTPPPSPTGPATPQTSPDAPRTPPPSPASPRAPRPSPSAAPNPPPSPQAALTLLPPQKAQENKQILPWVPMFGIPLILALPSNQQENLQQFWEKQKRDIEGMINFNSHELPLARVKRMMKSDDPLSKVAGDVPALFSKACEMFISELTLRGWFNTEKRHRRTLSPSDITEATYYTNNYDFLVDVIPWDRDLALKIALNGSGPTTDNSSYNGKGRINNANGGSSAAVIGATGGGCGMGTSLPSPAMWQRIPGMMMGPNSAGTGTDIGNFSVDMGSSGFVGMRYHYMPVEPTSVFPLLERGETPSSQSSGMRVPVYPPYGALPYQPSQGEVDDEPKLRCG